MENKDLIVLGFILAFLIPIVGLVICIIGLNRSNKENNHENKGLAIAGIIISALFIIMTPFMIGMLAYFQVLGLPQ